MIFLLILKKNKNEKHDYFSIFFFLQNFSFNNFQRDKFAYLIFFWRACCLGGNWTFYIFKKFASISKNMSGPFNVRNLSSQIFNFLFNGPRDKDFNHLIICHKWQGYEGQKIVNFLILRYNIYFLCFFFEYNFIFEN